MSLLAGYRKKVQPLYARIFNRPLTSSTLPKALRLQRLVNGAWCTVRELDVIPYSHQGLDSTKAQLLRQQNDWEYNYHPFSNSVWRIQSVYN